MIEHTQRFAAGFVTWGEANASEEIPGSCVQTAVASLLDLALDAVPHFALFANNWGGALKLWLEARGKHLRIYTDHVGDIEYWEYWGFVVAPFNSAPNDQMVIASGPSHNGPWSHVVVWKAGALVHDPHPSRKGLAGPPFEIWQITDKAVA